MLVKDLAILYGVKVCLKKDQVFVMACLEMVTFSFCFTGLLVIQSICIKQKGKLFILNTYSPI